MLKKIFPKNLRKAIKFVVQDLKSYIYDINRYFNFSKTTNFYRTELTLASQITTRYHVVEKGLTMPDMRLGFGKENILDLIKDLKIYEKKKFSKSNIHFLHALSVLSEYLNVHRLNNFELDKRIVEEIERFEKNYDITPSEQLEMTVSEYFTHQNDSFKNFAETRKSIRNFTNKRVEIEKVEEAIKIAQTSPSACNRQPSRVHIVSDKEKINQILKIQGGNRGFGHLGDKLLVVTGELSVFAGAGERNEVYTNVGLFSMSLLYGLHYKGIGSCVLNWSKNSTTDKELRKIIDIPKAETVVMILLIGYPVENLKIANSPRFDLEDIISII